MHLLLHTKKQNNFIYKRHLQFMTSASNFRGSADPLDPAFPTH